MGQKLFFKDQAFNPFSGVLNPGEASVPTLEVNAGIYAEQVTFSGAERILSVTALSIPSGNFTIAFWCCPAKLSVEQVILHLGDIMFLVDSSNNIVLRIANGGSPVNTTLLAAANWSTTVKYFIGAKFTIGTNPIVLQVGVTEITTASLAIAAISTQLSVGASFSLASPYTGIVDEVRMHSSHVDLLQLYRSYIVSGVRDTYLAAPDFVEESYRPSDAYYFPLDTDARGKLPAALYKTIDATIASNLGYSDEGCWVGTALTNLWPIKTALRGWQGTSTANGNPALAEAEYVELTKGAVAASHDTLDAANSLSISTGTYYTLSAYYRQVSGATLTPTQFVLAKSTAGAAIAKSSDSSDIPVISDQWERGRRTALYNEIVTAWPYISFPSASLASFRTCGHQLEAKPFVSAWTASSRGAGALAWNLHESVGLNWNTDYTIIYWRKPSGTTTDSVNAGYDMDSLGRNSNTLGGGFRWWGKGTGLTWGFDGAGVAISTATYQYSWMMVVLRRSGSNLTLRAYSEATGGLLLSQTVSDVVSTDNRYVTQNNYDLQLGGWDTANSTNAYFRDLTVLKRALSDAEVDAVYGSKLRIYTNSIYANSLMERGL